MRFQVGLVGTKEEGNRFMNIVCCAAANGYVGVSAHCHTPLLHLVCFIRDSR